MKVEGKLEGCTSIVGLLPITDQADYATADATVTLFKGDTVKVEDGTIYRYIGEDNDGDGIE